MALAFIQTFKPFTMLDLTYGSVIRKLIRGLDKPDAPFVIHCPLLHLVFATLSPSNTANARAESRVVDDSMADPEIFQRIRPYMMLLDQNKRPILEAIGGGGDPPARPDHTFSIVDPPSVSWSSEATETNTPEPPEHVWHSISRDT
jgi:hypothetical protein